MKWKPIEALIDFFDFPTISAKMKETESILQQEFLTFQDVAVVV